MTKHRIRARDPKDTVTVGWHSGTHLFMCEITGGGNSKTLAASDLTTLAAMMKPWAYLGNDTRAHLQADREADAS